VLAGAGTPPLEPCLRVLWPDIVGRDRLERAGLHWVAACSVIGVGWCLGALLTGYRLLAAPAR
jgi:hypothetical protein